MRGRQSALAAALVLLSAVAGTADTIHVPADQPTIQAGIDAAVEGDSVLVAQGTYVGVGNRDLDFGGVNLALVSEAGREATVINCEGASRALHFHSSEDTTAVVSGFTILNGFAASTTVGTRGGGILCEGGASPKISDCDIRDCVAWYGGGIACDASSPVIADAVLANNTASFGAGLNLDFGSCPAVRDATIEHNEAGAAGGGVHCLNGSSPVISRSVISSNYAEYFGGGLDLGDSSPSLTDVEISGNLAGYGGGMYCQDSSSPYLDGVSFAGNGAYFHGGGLGVNYRCSPVLNGCRFTDNQAAANGGGIYVSMNTVFDLPVLSDCSFERNKAWGSGGGLYLWTTQASVEGCDFVENEAVDNGGGLFCNMNAAPSLFDCTFVSNTAGEEGGGLYCFGDGANPDASYVLFDANTAGVAGGGVSCDFNSHPNISNATLVLNSAPEGGGVYMGLGASADVSTSIFAFNRAGGAVTCHEYTSVVEFTRCCVFGNTGGNEPCGSFSEIIYEDPRFCGFYVGDYSLCDNSSCLAGNNAWGQLIGAYPEGCDSCDAPAEPMSWGSIKAMYR